MLRFLTAGESHGPGLVTIVEGLPAGLPFSRDDLSAELARRRLGFGRGRRMAIEQDELEVLGGIRFGRTIGGPVAVSVRNTEWPKWQEEMSAEPGEPRRPLTSPRPGHADLAGMLKYDTHDARDILERSSARETAARTVAGYLAKALLGTFEASVISHVVSIGKVQAPDDPAPGPDDGPAIDRSPVRCFSPDASAAMVDEIEAAHRDRDSLGGVFEVLAFGIPPGLGSHVHHDRRLDGRLAGALMSIQAIKGVEIGDGFESARRRGSEAHDEIQHGETGFSRVTNRSGGLEGGITTGATVRVRGSMKPLSTLMRPLRTVDVTTKEQDVAFRERTDTCAVPAAAVVGETMVAWVLADEAVRKFGGDTVGDLQAAVAAYRSRLTQF